MLHTQVLAESDLLKKKSCYATPCDASSVTDEFLHDPKRLRTKLTCKEFGWQEDPNN